MSAHVPRTLALAAPASGWASGDALFEPAPPPPTVEPHRGKARGRPAHVVDCARCGVELILNEPGPARCSQCLASSKAQPLAAGTLVLSPLHNWRGYVLRSLNVAPARTWGYRIYWSSLRLEGVSLAETLTPVCPPAKLDVMARWHRGRAAQVQARRLSTATTVPRDVLAEMAREVSDPRTCEGVGRRVPYFDVLSGRRAACPVCGFVLQVIDDRDGSVFTVPDHLYTRRPAGVL